MYRNVVYNGRESTVTLFTWDQDGKRISTECSFEPYLYVEDNRGDKTSIFGTKVKKKKFNTAYNRYKFLQDSGLKRVFENCPPVQQFLLDSYWQENEKPEFNTTPIKYCFLDIETYSVDSFPDVDNPTHTVNVITCWDNFTKKFHTFGIKEYTGKGRDDLIYVHCRDERAMFVKFLEYLETDFPDILSGWNSEFFDIPYIINRMERVLGQDYVNRLSPLKNVHFRAVKGKFGKDQKRYYVDGIACLDYLDVYRRFCLKLRESYKLDAIGEVELGENKIDYGGMSLHQLADEDWNTFIDYNIQDVNLLVRLEEKLQYIPLLRMLSYVGLTTLEGAMGTIQVINGALTIRARKRGEIISTFLRNAGTGKNPGAYVAEPKRGFKKNIVSFDANSLYPNVMISLNTSPETKIGKIEKTTDDKVTIQHVSGKLFELTKPDFVKFVKAEECALSKAGFLFSQKKKGIIPEFLEYYYNQRVKIKEKLFKCKQALKKDPNNIELKYEVERLNTSQMVIKILVNSCYGYMGNKNAPIGDDDIASSVTLTGQAVIKESNKQLKKYISENIDRDISDHELEECIIYNDTDSLVYDTKVNINGKYISIGELYDKYAEGNDIDNSNYGHEVINVDDVSAATFHTLEGVNKTSKVRRLIRHKVSKRKFKIKVGDKEVIMTEDHGLMIKRGENIIRISPKEFKRGDKVLIMNMSNVQYVDFEVEELDAFEDEYVYDLEMHNQDQPWFYANDILVHNSSYISISPLVENGIKFFEDEEKGLIHQETYDEIQRIEDKLNEGIDQWARKALLTKDPRFVFKRECIADVGVFLQKKRYVMHILDDEGIKENKFKYTGVEVVRTTMPNAIKPYAKKIIETMLLTQSLAKTNEVLNETYEVFKTLTPEDMAFVMGVKSYEKYAVLCNEFSTTKGMPIHVKSAYFYNLMLDKLKTGNRYESISSGDKVRYMYVEQPNRYGLDSIGFKHEHPSEFNEIFKPDYDKMFEKILFQSIQRFYDNVKWTARRPTDNVQTELFELFS